MSANRLNNRFVDSVVKLTSTVKIAPAQWPPHESAINPFLLRPVVATEIRRIIDSLPCLASYGHDNVSISMLKKSPMVVMKVLGMIFNKSITTNIFLSRRSVQSLHQFTKRVTYMTRLIIDQ